MAAYGYDSTTGDLLSIDYSSGGTHRFTHSMTYDDKGRVHTVTSPTGTETLTYDADDHVTSETLPHAGNYSVNYGYDSNGRLNALSLLDNDSQPLLTYSYGYSAGTGRSSSVSAGEHSYYWGYQSNSHLPKNVVYDDVMVLVRTYEGNSNRLLSIDTSIFGGPTLCSNAFAYNAMDQKTQVDVSAFRPTIGDNDEFSWHYGYDGALSVSADGSVVGVPNGGNDLQFLENWGGGDGDPWPARWTWEESSASTGPSVAATLEDQQGKVILHTAGQVADAIAYGNSPALIALASDATVSFKVTENADQFGLVARGRFDGDAFGGGWDDTGLIAYVVGGQDTIRLCKRQDGQSASASYSGTSISSGTEYKMRFRVESAIPGDCGLDGSVNGDDFVTFAINYTGSGGTGKTWSQADFDGDGDVDGDDFVILAVNYTGTWQDDKMDMEKSGGQVSTAVTNGKKPVVLGDLTHDGKVDEADWKVMVDLAARSKTKVNLDFNGDGKEDVNDLYCLVSQSHAGLEKVGDIGTSFFPTWPTWTTVLRVKVWAASGSEPANWMVDTSDTPLLSGRRLFVGRNGLFFGGPSDNPTDRTTYVDDFQAEMLDGRVSDDWLLADSGSWDAVWGWDRRSSSAGPSMAADAQGRRGRVQITTNNQNAAAIAYRPGLASMGSEQRVIFSLGSLKDRFGLVARGSLNGSDFGSGSNDTYYRANVGGSDTTPQVRLIKVVSGTETPLASANITGLAANAEYHMRLLTLDGDTDNLKLQVWPVTSNAGSWTLVATDSALSAGSPGMYFEAAHDSGHASDPHSFCVDNWTIDADTPEGPTGLLVTAVSHSRIDLAWLDNSRNESGFKVERSPDGSSNWVPIGQTAAGVTVYSDSGLATPGATYHYRVRAYTDAGDSPPSTTGYATIPTVPSAVDPPKDHLSMAVARRGDSVVPGRYFAYAYDGRGNRTSSLEYSGQAKPWSSSAKNQLDHRNVPSRGPGGGLCRSGQHGRRDGHDYIYQDSGRPSGWGLLLCGCPSGQPIAPCNGRCDGERSRRGRRGGSDGELHAAGAPQHR